MGAKNTGLRSLELYSIKIKNFDFFGYFTWLQKIEIYHFKRIELRLRRVLFVGTVAIGGCIRDLNNTYRGYGVLLAGGADDMVL